MVGPPGLQQCGDAMLQCMQNDTKCNCSRNYDTCTPPSDGYSPSLIRLVSMLRVPVCVFVCVSLPTGLVTLQCPQHVVAAAIAACEEAGCQNCGPN